MNELIISEILNSFKYRKLLYKRKLKHMDMSMNIYCNSYEAFQWLRSLTEKLYIYEETFDEEKADYFVYSLYDSKEYEKIARLLSDIDGKYMDTHHYEKAKNYQKGCYRIIWSEKTECVFCVEEERIFMIGKGDCKNSLFEFSRVVREVFTRKGESRGYFLMHAAALEKDGKVYVFTGEKGAGKTTTLLSLMKQGFNLLSNDRVFLYVKDGKLFCITWPGAVAISIDNAFRDKEIGSVCNDLKYLAYPQQRMTNLDEYIDNNDNYYSKFPYDKFDLSCDEIASLFNVKYVTSGEVKSVFNIYLDKECVIKKAFLYPMDNSYPNWLMISNNETYSAAEDSFKEVLGKVEDFTLYLRMLHDDKDYERILEMIREGKSMQ